ncbi:sensor histidine kinase [Thermogemmatispora aurantia]|nr:HAMP domain-containing sensor histidine kinase [Thermogemmatispora aurantia]
MPAERGTVRIRTEGAPDGSTDDEKMNESLADGTTVREGQGSSHTTDRAEATALTALQRRHLTAGPLVAASVRLPLDRLSLRLALWQLAILALGLALMTLLIFLLTHVRSLNTPLAFVCAYGLLVLLLGSLSVLTTALLLRPLQELARIAQALAKGDFSQRALLPSSASPPAPDELTRLGQSLNALAGQVELATTHQHESEARVQRLLSSASHELRTPLTSIRGLSEVLLRGPVENPELLQRVLRLIKNESERMTRLINDMLTLVRLEEGRPLQVRTVDLVELAVESVEQARLFSGEQGPRIQLELATQERLVVHGDMDRLKQALAALLDNAVKYGRPFPEGQVIVRLDRHADRGEIQVIDNGPGIAPEDLPYIFERFYRGRHIPPSRADGSAIPGAGLGLAIARAIAHAHQGEVSVHSEPDKGSVFTLTLPCLSGSPTRPLSPAPGTES